MYEDALPGMIGSGMPMMGSKMIGGPSVLIESLSLSFFLSLLLLLLLLLL
jgi:hypothetical protein